MTAPTETPRTDEVDTYPNDYHKMWCHAEQLERELIAARGELEEEKRYHTFSVEGFKSLEKKLRSELEKARGEIEVWKGQAQWEREEAERVGAIRLRQAEEIERLKDALLQKVWAISAKDGKLIPHVEIVNPPRCA